VPAPFAFWLEDNLIVPVRENRKLFRNPWLIRWRFIFLRGAAPGILGVRCSAQNHEKAGTQNFAHIADPFPYGLFRPS
jgi:hypothetical protein